MSIPLTLEIPTIIKYSKNILRPIDNLEIYGINFNSSSVVYFYTGTNFKSGTLINPISITSDKIVLPNLTISGGIYNFLVYNADSKLYSNNFNIEIIQNLNNNNAGLAPQLVTSHPYAARNINFFPFSKRTTNGSHQNINNDIDKVLVVIDNFTYDTIILCRDSNNPNRYFKIHDNILYPQYENNQDYKFYLQTFDYNHRDSFFYAIMPIGYHSITMPYGTHTIYAINQYGISNPHTFSLSNTNLNIPENTVEYSNIENDSVYTYQSSSCKFVKTIKSVYGYYYPISNYSKYMFSADGPVRETRYDVVNSPVDTHTVIIVYDNNQTCASVECLIADLFPIGAGTSKFMTSSNTVFNAQCPVEIIGLQGTATEGPTPLWDAWKLYSETGAVPAIPICGEQGELTKTYTIEFTKKVQAENYDLICEINSTTNNAINVSIERWNEAIFEWQAVVTDQSTGSWSIGSIVKKTILIPAHAATFKYRITHTVLSDTSSNPTHLMKNARLY